MEYRVEELARAAGVRVDTIRYYQAKGLLPPPKKVKRSAVYSSEHLDRIRQIQHYQSQGLSLSVIKRLVTSSPRGTVDTLLKAVADQSGERTLTRADVARLSGVPEPLLAAIESAGLSQPMKPDGAAQYGAADVQMARAGLDILSRGFPIDELLRLAIRHAKNVEEVADQAVDLFDRFVRKVGNEGVDPDTVADDFRRLLPAVTTLVAQHFQRTLLNRALLRLKDHGEQAALEATRAVLGSGHLEVKWR